MRYNFVSLSTWGNWGYFWCLWSVLSWWTTNVAQMLANASNIYTFMTAFRFQFEFDVCEVLHRTQDAQSRRVSKIGMILSVFFSMQMRKVFFTSTSSCWESSELSAIVENLLCRSRAAAFLFSQDRSSSMSKAPYGGERLPVCSGRFQLRARDSRLRFAWNYQQLYNSTLRTERQHRWKFHQKIDLSFLILRLAFWFDMTKHSFEIEGLILRSTQFDHHVQIGKCGWKVWFWDQYI